MVYIIVNIKHRDHVRVRTNNSNSDDDDDDNNNNNEHWSSRVVYVY